MNGIVTLAVGDIHRLRTGKDRICYAGMPTPEVYSVVQIKWESMYRGYSWNLYFPVAQRQIRIDGVNLTVEHVDTREIALRG